MYLSDICIRRSFLAAVTFPKFEFVFQEGEIRNLPLVAQDEIHHRRRILARQREVALAFGHQYRDLSPEFLVPLLHHSFMILSPFWILAKERQPRQMALTVRLRC
jgi:hypothetical protein